MSIETSKVKMMPLVTVATITPAVELVTTATVTTEVDLVTATTTATATVMPKIEKPVIKLEDLDKNKVYYLASPYTSKDQELMNERYLLVDSIGYDLMLKGYHLIEPIAATHHKALRFKLPSDYSFWKERCTAMIRASNGIIVAMIHGWKQSVGVTDEIKIATELGIPVVYLEVEEKEQ